MLPTTGGGDEEIRYTIALEGAAQAQTDVEKLTAGVKEFNTQLATAIQLVKQLMEQFSGKGGAAPQLPEFQKAFENQVQTQSNISLGVWEKAVQEIDKMNVGIKTASDYINLMSNALKRAEQDSILFGAGLTRNTAQMATLSTQTADTITKIDQLAQKLGTGTPELKTPTPTEIVQPKVNPEVLQQAASGVEHLVKAETDLVEVNKKVEASTPKVITTPPVEEVKPVTIPVITADAGTAIDKLKTKEDELKASSQQLVQPLEQVDQASKKAQGGSENLTLGLSKLGEQTKLTKQGVQDLNKAIEAQPEKVTVAPEITTPAITNVPTQAVASLDALDQEQQKVKTSADALAQSETAAGQAAGSMGQQAAAAGSGGVVAFKDQVEQAKVSIQSLMDKFGGGRFTTEVAAQFEVAKIKSPLDPAAWEQALQQLVAYKNAAPQVASATQTLIQPMIQADQATSQFNIDVQNLTNQLLILASQGKTVGDFATVFGQSISDRYSPEVIAEALKQTNDISASFAGLPSKVGDFSTGLDQAAQVAQRLREIIDRLKADIQDLSASKGISLADATRGITAVQSTPVEKRMAGVALSEIQSENAQRIKEAEATVKQITLLEKEGSKEIAVQDAQHVKEKEASNRQIVSLEQDSEKALAEEHKLRLAQQAQVEKDYDAQLKQWATERQNINKQNSLLQIEQSKAVYNADIAQISQAKQALRELAATKMISPLAASQTSEFQAMGFNPATTRAGLEELGNQFDKTGVRKDAFKVNLQTLWATFKQGATPIQGIKNAFQLLVQGFSTGGGILSAVIGGVFGFGLIGIIHTAINGLGQLLASFNQAATGALEFLDATFKLEIGLRDAQRKGFDATRDELVKFSKDFKEKYPMFSNVAIRKGLADMIFFTKELGVSAQDAFKMFDSSAALAIATGKDVGEVMRMIALAASSGYSEGLQRMGLNINKVTITERAHAMGIKESYMAMKQEDRAAALLNLVLEQTAGITADAAEKQKTLAGWVETVAAKQTDAATKLGKAWLPIKTFFDEIGMQITQFTAMVVEQFTKFIADLVGSFYALRNVWNLFQKGNWVGKDLGKAIDEAVTSGIEEAANKFGQKEFYFDAKAQLKVELETAGLSDADKQKVYEATDSFIETLEKSITDYQDSQVEAAQKYQEDLVKIEQDGLEKRAKLDEEYAQKQKDIEFKLHQDTEKAQLDLERSIADINLKANQDTQKAKEEAKQKELDLEKEYADKVAKLQRDLEFDLEEAVRARDATAVRRLKRQYGKDLTELDIQKQNDKQQIQHDLQLRLQEIQQRRLLDIQQRQIDFQQKMADLQAQAVLERQQALENYNKDLADLQASLAKQRIERKKAYNDQLKDLYDAFTKRLKMASEALAKEVGMNAQAAQAVASYLVALYGPNGVFQKVYDYMIAYITKGKNDIIANFNPNNLGISKQAEGGDYLVKHPTLFLAGEKGAERATFLPMNKPVPMPLISGAGGTNEQYVRVMVDLGPDLVGRIVERSIDEFADIIVENG